MLHLHARTECVFFSSTYFIKYLFFSSIYEPVCFVYTSLLNLLYARNYYHLAPAEVLIHGTAFISSHICDSNSDQLAALAPEARLIYLNLSLPFMVPCDKTHTKYSTRGSIEFCITASSLTKLCGHSLAPSRVLQLQNSS